MISLAHESLKLNPETKIAIIYSIAENSSFIVEIHYQAKSHYISTADHPTQFASLSLAKKAAAKEGASEGYHALENLYQEVGISTETSINTNSRYEYIHFNID